MPVPTVQILGHDPSQFRGVAAPPMRTVKLGRIKPVARPSVPRLAAFVDAYKGAPPPPSISYSEKAMASLKLIYGNDQWGDCVIAGKFHALGVWSGNDGPACITGTTNEAVSEYHRLCGPGDNGCNISAVLDAFKSGGISVGGVRRKIDGYVSLDTTNKAECQLACLLFGGFTIGFNVPQEWTGSGAYDGAVWDTPRRFSFVGGHDVRIVGYDEVGVQLATWGLVLTMTWAALANTRIVDEGYVELSPNWYNDDQLAPNGIKVAELKAALDIIGGGGLPPWEPPAPPSPPTPPVPPVPPVPPTPPTPATVTIPSLPVYIGSLNVGHTGSVTVPVAPPKAAGVASVAWFQLFRDIMQLERDLPADALSAAAAGVGSFVQHLAARDWAACRADVSAIQAAVAGVNWAVLAADLAAIAADLGVTAAELAEIGLAA